MKIAKTKKCSLLSNEALDDLLTITSAQMPLKEFSPDEAIDLWWSDRVRRRNQNLESLTGNKSTPEKFKKKWLPVSQRQLLIMYKSCHLNLKLKFGLKLSQTLMSLSTCLVSGMTGWGSMMKLIIARTV